MRKGRIGKPEAEREPQGNVVFAVIAIADLRPLGIDLVDSLAEGFVRGNVLIAHRPRLGELAGRVFHAEQQIIDRRAAVLSRQIHIENRVNFIAERNLERRTAEQDDDDLLPAFRKRVDQPEMAFRHAHVLAVAALGFVFVRQPRKDQDRVALLERVRLYAVRVERVLRRRDLRRSDHGAARALIAHVFKELARNVQLLRAGKRQHAVVLQQHRAVRGDLGGKRMMRIPIHRLRIGGLDGFADPVEDVPAGFVEILHRERAVFDAVKDPPAADRRIARHFKVESGFQACDAVVHRAPVGHDDAVEAPFFSENVGKQPFVL